MNITTNSGFQLDPRLPGDPEGLGAFDVRGFGAAPQTLFHYDEVKFQLAAVPEPSAIALAIAGLGTLGFLSRRRRRETPVAA